MPDGLADPKPEAPARSEPIAAGLRLVVSAHFVYAGQVGGAEHMFYNLLNGLRPRVGRLDVLCSSAGRLAADMRETLESDPKARLIECGGGGPRFVAEQRACLRPDLAGDAILFPNYFVPPLVPARLGRVATVLHDMQYRHYPQTFSRKKRMFLRAAHEFATRRADRLIVISDFVADDVARTYGDRMARKLAVIPNPVSWERFAGAEGMKRPIEAPYVLSVAAQYRHKNLPTLVRGFAEAAKRNRELQLVLVGQSYGGLRGVPGASESLAPLVASLGIADRVHLTGYVDDATLGNWYRHAELFAFPSVFEGFGMPPVEALGFGLPTIVSRRTALPEVTLGFASELEDALSPSAWADRMLEVARAPSKHRPNLAQIAWLRAHYAPDRIARRYVEVLRD